MSECRTNYPTWVFKDWIDRDSNMRSIIAEHVDACEGDVSRLAYYIEDFAVSDCEEIFEHTNDWQFDVFQWALCQIDFDEVAKVLLEEFDENVV